jgi:hypothetical protein
MYSEGSLSTRTILAPRAAMLQVYIVLPNFRDEAIYPTGWVWFAIKPGTKRTRQLPRRLGGRQVRIFMVQPMVAENCETVKVAGPPVKTSVPIWKAGKG